MIKNRYIRKYLLIGITSFLIVISQPLVLLAQVSSNPLQQAEIFVQRGQEQLNQGQASEALQSWQQATQIYRQLKDDEGITGSLINQSVALQSLGLSPRACNILVEALKLNSGICDTSSRQANEEAQLLAIFEKQTPSSVNLLGLQNLGNILRRLGKLSESEKVLQTTLLLSQQTSNFDNSSVLLSLGNTKFAFYKQLKDKYVQIEEPAFQKTIFNVIEQKALEATDIYQQIIHTEHTSTSVKLQSLLQKLNLLLDFSKRSNNNQYENQIKAIVSILSNNSSFFDKISASESIYARLNFANSLNKIPDKNLHLLAIKYASNALKTANHLQNKRLISYSLGTLGKLKPEQAETYFLQALSLAQSVQDGNIAYQWQQQLGNLYKQQRDYSKAIKYYNAAVENWSNIRDNLLLSNVDLQFSFYENIEPVYRDYLWLLLASPNPNLKKVVQTYEKLQLAELENYLGCGKLDFISVSNLKNLPNKPAIINIIDLGDHIEVIMQSSDDSLHRHSVDSKTIKNDVQSFLESLQAQNLAATQEPTILSYSQTLYQQLIAPIKKYLPSDGTLLFTLDKSFQSIPMSLLHDGKDYLIQHYSIATTSGSRIRPPKFLTEKQLKALIAGLSKTSPSFNAPNAPQDLKPLPEVVKEAFDVKQQTRESTKLLNEDFTSLRFRQELKAAKFPIVHVTTHGQFSSDPERTVLLAWDKPINIREFDGWLKVQNNQDPIELLVLSACQTAKGNKRSTLGIAGVAAQAGARSTVASLWLVDAESTSMLVEEFYKGLNNNLTKAEALRQAQLSLLSNPQYQHPYYWAGFILVGSWL